MIIRQPRPRRLQLGDKVRLARGTSTWAQHFNLRDRTGEVIDLIDDGTPDFRVTVAFDGTWLPPGLPETVFEKVPD
ncbi:hypothetical protein [Rubellimicrobium arenae]|uniref:hypothetical protein n=1 Tax=Rubellimicrobium arenae TaxID=2817372 RepID=UPI001B316C3E|nr:hypothetical protein [Rubellimicrobium arenae]